MLKTLEKLLITGLVALGFCAPTVSAALSESEFTEKFVPALTALIPGRPIVVLEPLRLAITDRSGQKVSIFLDNAFADYLRDQQSIDAVIQRYADAFKETLTQTEEVAVDRIVPVIKDRQWLEDMRYAGGASELAQGKERVFETLNEQLVIVYAEDTPSTTRYFSAESLQATGVAKEALRALAVTNLRKLLPEIELHQGEHVSMLTAGGDYVASLLLFDELWQPGRFDIEGEVVVAVPSRDVLLFTGSNDLAGISKLKDLAEKAVSDSSYRLTSRLFVYRNGEFVLFAD